MKRIQGIYRIMHIESGHLYIGRTVDWVRRQRAHVWHLERGKHQNPKLQRAWDKYGAEAFRFEFLEEVERSQLVSREQAYLDDLQPFFNVAMDAANPVLGPVKTHCPAGHAYEGENRRVTRDGGIKCRACNAARQLARNHKQRAAAGLPPPNPTKHRTHCPQGHAYADHGAFQPNGWRYCKVCNRARARAYYHDQVAAAGRTVGPKTGTQTHCPHGHEYSPENTRIAKDGARQCRACGRDRHGAEVEAKKAAGTYKSRVEFIQELHATQKANPLSHCRRGHEFTPKNTRLDRHGWRQCKACDAIRDREGRAAKAASEGKTVQPRKGTQTQCPQGHEYTPENTLFTREGWRLCATCRKEHNACNNALHAAKKKAARRARQKAEAQG